MLSYRGFMESERYVYTFILDCPSISLEQVREYVAEKGKISKVRKLRGDRCKLVMTDREGTAPYSYRTAGD